jgi:hypothetical protein
VKAAVLEAERQLAYATSRTRARRRRGAARGEGERGVRLGRPPLPSRAPNVSDVLGHEAAGIVSATGRASTRPPRATCRAHPAGAMPRLRPVSRRTFSACATYSFIGSRRDGAFAQLVGASCKQSAARSGRPAVRGRRTDRAIDGRATHAGPGSLPVRGHAVVFGAGSIGLMLVQWLRIVARLILATDLVAGSRGGPGAGRASHPGPPTTTSPRRSCGSPVGRGPGPGGNRLARPCQTMRSRARAARSCSAATSLSTRACP